MKDYYPKFLIVFIVGLIITLSLLHDAMKYNDIKLPETDPYQDSVMMQPETGYIPPEYLERVHAAHSETGVPVHVLHSVISTESNYKPWIDGHMNSNGTYDIGLMQLNSRYLEEFVDKYWDKEEHFDVYSASHNMFIGASILVELHGKLGTWERAVKAYNTGIGSVLRGKRTESANKYYDRVIDKYVAMRRAK